MRLSTAVLTVARPVARTVARPEPLPGGCGTALSVRLGTALGVDRGRTILGRIHRPGLRSASGNYAMFGRQLGISGLRPCARSCESLLQGHGQAGSPSVAALQLSRRPIASSRKLVSPLTGEFGATGLRESGERRVRVELASSALVIERPSSPRRAAGHHRCNELEFHGGETALSDRLRVLVAVGSVNPKPALCNATDVSGECIVGSAPEHDTDTERNGLLEGLPREH